MRLSETADKGPSRHALIKNDEPAPYVPNCA